MAIKDSERIGLLAIVVIVIMSLALLVIQPFDKSSVSSLNLGNNTLYLENNTGEVNENTVGETTPITGGSVSSGSQGVSNSQSAISIVIGNPQKVGSVTVSGGSVESSGPLSR